MDKINKKDFLVLPIFLVLFVLGSIDYFTRDYVSAIFYSVLLVIYILINILAKLDILVEYTRSILYSFFRKELDKSKESLDELKKLSDEIAREIEDMKDKIAEDIANITMLSIEEAELSKSKSKKVAKKTTKKESVDKTVEEVSTKHRGRPKKIDK